jgi:hypothetical protein
MLGSNGASVLFSPRLRRTLLPRRLTWKRGQLRLVNLNKRVNDLLQMTRLSAVFDIEGDEASAVRSLRGDITSEAAA